ncbi:hypothetical protein [Methylophilus sp. UBA6697]|uniref:hypothetical protein n=1 Tax=Methylophilus sp. UBA6697 TaxID=1946902 RepID=UPI0025CFD65E|nr:hypothetical protein [Methylophilus sp. UBA6697]
MDISEIPVLTKVVQKTAAPAIEMDELVAQLKQALLPEITQLVTAQLADKSTDTFAAGQQSLADYANTLQQEVLAKAQSQVGDSIQAIEQAFREAMGNVSKQQLQAFEEQVTQLTETQQTQIQSSEQSFQATLESNLQQQLQAVEEKLSQLGQTQQQLLAATEQTVRDTVDKASQQWLGQTLSPLVDAQQAQMESRLQSLREQLEQGLVEHLQQLQETNKQTLSDSQASAATTLVADYKQSLQEAFTELNAAQMAEFKQGMQTELAASEPVLQEKVAALVATAVATQLQEMEAEMNKRLKSRILEVLQGIKFVMPTI